MAKKHFTETKAYKTFYKYLAGWGGSIVVIGAMFKILHLPNGGLILMLGMIIEAIIFFVSVFDKDHVTYEWEKVYPHLMMEEEELEQSGIHANSAAPVHPSAPAPQPTNAVAAAPQTAVVAPTIDINIDNDLVDNFNENLKKATEALAVFSAMSSKKEDVAELMDKSLENLKELTNSNETYVNSIGNFTDTLNDNNKNFVELSNSLSKASEASSKLDVIDELGDNVASYNKSIENASSSIDKLTDNTVKSSEKFDQLGSTIDSSMETVQSSKEGFQNFNQGLNESKSKLDDLVNDFTQEYKKSIEGLNSDNGYSENISELNKNITTLNSVFEVQAQKVNSNISNLENFETEVSKLSSAYTQTADKMDSINQRMGNLESKIEELDKVYGNMLSTINE